jgi:hypothetical protein
VRAAYDFCGYSDIFVCVLMFSGGWVHYCQARDAIVAQREDNNPTPVALSAVRGCAPLAFADSGRHPQWPTVAPAVSEAPLPNAPSEV